MSSSATQGGHKKECSAQPTDYDECLNQIARNVDETAYNHSNRQQYYTVVQRYVCITLAKTQTLSCYEIQDKQNQKITKHTQETESRTYPRAVSHDGNCIRCLYNVDDNYHKIRSLCACSAALLYNRLSSFYNFR